MINPTVRWWVIFSVTTIAIGSALIGGGAEFILAKDATMLSWLIIALFFGGSIHWGYKVAHNGADADPGPTEYFMRTSSGLGLLGTVLGLILMSKAIAAADPTDAEQAREAATQMISGLGIALTTTFVGLISSQLLRLQVAAIKEKWRA